MLMKNAPEHDLAYTTMKMDSFQKLAPVGSAENFETYDDFAPSVSLAENIAYLGFDENVNLAKTFDFALAVNLVSLDSAHHSAPLGSA